VVGNQITAGHANVDGVKVFEGPAQQLESLLGNLGDFDNGLVEVTAGKDVIPDLINHLASLNVRRSLHATIDIGVEELEMTY